MNEQERFSRSIQDEVYRGLVTVQEARKKFGLSPFGPGEVIEADFEIMQREVLDKPA
jgi:hypothetical protein